MVLAAVATAANVVAHGLAPTVGIPEWMVGVSRVLAVCTTWLLIEFSVHFHRRSQLVVARLEENQARLRLASEAADLGFWGNDLATGEVIFDERWVGMLGYRPEEVEYTAAWYDGLVHPDDRCDVERAWRKHLSGQVDSFEVEHRLMRRDGSWRRVLTKGRVIERDLAGTPLRAAGTHLDVTLTRELERQAEEALRDRYQELQLVTDKIPMMIGYVDANERFCFNNSACARVFRAAPSEIKGRKLDQLLGSSTYNQLRQHFASALRGESVQFEEVVTLAGDKHWWLVHLLPREDDDGRVLGFFMLATDVSGIRKNTAGMDRQREALALHTNRGVANEMEAAIAHELNQPLATISIYASELVRDLDTGKVEAKELASALRMIDEESHRAGQIMRRVRKSVDNRSPNTVLTDVRELLQSVRQICECRARSAGVPINVCVDDGADHVQVDRLQLQQVLVNLVNNAIDASAEIDAERKHITLHASADSEGLHFRVVDQGHGLPGQHLKRVFTPYYTTKPGGLGIGLNICQSIVAAHCGKLWATQNETDGATFHVSLPYVAAVEAETAVLCEAR
jgi:PAS domain S-box-containing protein